MRATVHDFALPLRQPLVTAAGTTTIRKGCLLRVEDADGHVGWGEAAPLLGFPGGSGTEVSAALAHWCSQPDRATQSELAAVPLAAAAVDTALVGLEALRASSSLAVHLAGSDVASSVPVNALLTVDDPHDDITSAARRAVDGGFATVKIKLGRHPVDDDIACVTAVRDAVGPDVAIRLDANRAWSAAEARVVLAAVEPLGIEYIEEPTADLDAWPGLAELGVPLAADESLVDPGPDQPLQLMRDGHVRVLVAKIPLLSGVRPALAAAGVAAARGAGVVVTSFVDTAVGLAAATHLAAALGPGHPAAGLATGSMLAADVAVAPLVTDGFIAVPAGPGLGVVPDLDALGG